MIKVTLKQWRAVGVAATLSLAAACGGEGGSGGEAGGEGGEGGGEGGEPAATAPATPAGEGGEGARAGGGEAGEAGAASAYAGVSGDQLTALRLQHLRGFILVATAVANENQTDEAAILVQQGLLEVFDAAPTEFGSLDVALVRAAGETGLNRAQIVSRLRAAETEIDRASSALEVDHAALAARMVDIATGLYQIVNTGDHVDALEYQHSYGAALAARNAITEGSSSLRRENLAAFSEAQGELNRFVALWPDATAPATPASYQQVLAAGSRVRLALSPFL